MSKYSTEELVAWTKNLCTWDMVSDTSIRDAIIAKLRAADKLCEAARNMINVQPFIKDFPRFTADLRKAVADYGGKS